MKFFVFITRLLGTSCAIAIAGTIGTYFIGWRRPFPTSWVWLITSVIGGFVSYFCFGAEIWKIVFVGLVWPVVVWFGLGISFGLYVSVYELRSRSQRKSGASPLIQC